MAADSSRVNVQAARPTELELAADEPSNDLTLGEMKIVGRIVPGRGIAAGIINRFSDDLESILGHKIYLGSLNVLLNNPLLFNDSRALRFDNDYRLIWPGRLNGLKVWIYRWESAPLHVVEVLSDYKLRDRLSLRDGEQITLAVDRRDTIKVPWPGRVIWNLCWRGRGIWAYKSPFYCFITAPLGRNLGATQEGVNIKVMSFANKLKSGIKNLPIIGKLAQRFARAIKPKYRFLHERPSVGETMEQRALRQVRNVLNYAKLTGTDYSAIHYPAGYHTLEVLGQRLKGQRDPFKRLDKIPIDFAGKTILDIGTNQGGMLFPLKDTIKYGVGIDYDPKKINCANRIKDIVGAKNLSFYVFDLENDPFEIMNDFLPDGRFDICYLLSVCMWIKNWKQLIRYCADNCSVMLFESNGTDNQQREQVEFLRQQFPKVSLLSESSDDDPGQPRRKLFLCSNQDGNPIFT